jgi:hypothetical protein
LRGPNNRRMGRLAEPKYLFLDFGQPGARTNESPIISAY